MKILYLPARLFSKHFMVNAYFDFGAKTFFSSRAGRHIGLPLAMVTKCRSSGGANGVFAGKS
jgi:hypothetical protein